MSNRSVLTTIALAGLTAVWGAVVTAPTSAAPAAEAEPWCQAGVQRVDRCVARFDHTGAPQYFTVPPDITELTVAMKGGDGGSFLNRWPDWAGVALPSSFTTPVTPGERLVLIVGGAGTSGTAATTAGIHVVPGGYGGGGNGCAMNVRGTRNPDYLAPIPGKSGGGGTFIFRDDPDRTLVAATGGGGAYAYTLETGRGSPGAPGSPTSARRGDWDVLSATQTEPGQSAVGVGLTESPLFRWIRGNAGTGPATLDADHQLVGARGGDARCGGGWNEPATWVGEGLDWYATGAGGGGLYGGASGGAYNTNRRTDSDMFTLVAGGGGGSGIVAHGTPVADPRTDLDTTHGLIEITYTPATPPPTTTTSPTSTTVQPPATTNPTTTTAPPTTTTTTADDIAVAGASTTSTPSDPTGPTGSAHPTGSARHPDPTSTMRSANPAPPPGPTELARTGSPTTRALAASAGGLLIAGIAVTTAARRARGRARTGRA